MAADVIDYEVHGDDMQFVEIELDPDRFYYRHVADCLKRKLYGFE